MYAERCMISSPQHLCVAKHWVTVVEGRFVASQSQVATDRQVCQMLARYTRHGYPVEEMHGPNLGCDTADKICLAQYVLLHLGCHPHLSRLKVCMPRKEPYQAHVSTTPYCLYDTKRFLASTKLFQATGASSV